MAPSKTIKFRYGISYIVFAVMLLSVVSANAQPFIMQHNKFFAQDADRQAAHLDNTYNATVKPFVNGLNYNKEKLDSLYNHQYHTKSFQQIFWRKLKHESLLLVDSPNFKIMLDPLFYFELGKDLKKTNETYYTNTRGVLIRGSIGQTFAFESTFLENQAEFPDYVSAFVSTWGVAPGQGRVKSFKKSGADYAGATGVMVYKPNKMLNFMAGSGKLFLGDGYRSLWLSDNAFSYPFFKANLNFQKLSYTAAWASMQIIQNGKFVFNPLSEPIFKKKVYTFQYVSYRPIKRVDIGLFQAVMWKAQQTGNTKFDYNILNPLVFAHSAQYGLDSANNVMLGANINVKITHSINAYAQVMADNLKNNQIGWQGGIKYFDVAAIKNLYLQLEYNKVNAYSYSFPNAYQSFSHYNQSLAHPVGANFSEMVALTNYRFKDFYAALKFNYISTGLDSFPKYYAGNQVITDYQPANVQSNTFLNKGKTQIIDFKLGYIINRGSNLNIAVGAMLRDFNSNLKYGKLKTDYFYISIGTAITNKYYDF